MQVQNGTDDDLDLEIEGGRPGVDTKKQREVVSGKGGVMEVELGFGKIFYARVFEKDTENMRWEQHFPKGAHDLVVRNPFVELVT